MGLPCIKQSENSNILVISLDEHFDYSCLQGFQRFYEQQLEPICHYVVDMKHTHSLDSSALGMLFHLYRTVHQQGVVDVSIVNCNSYILRILKLSHFDKKFQINCLDS